MCGEVGVWGGGLFTAQGVVNQSLLGRGPLSEFERVENASSPQFHNVLSKLLSGRCALKHTGETAVLGSRHPLHQLKPALQEFGDLFTPCPDHAM